MIKEEIKKAVEKAIKKLGNSHMPEVLVEVPKDKTHGDYFTNAAFELTKALKKTPNEIALLLKSELEKSKFFKEIKVVGAFINFFLNDTFFNENITQILKQEENFGSNKNLKNKKVIIEYANTNILKEFHIGHLMGIAIGESLSRIFEFQGAKIKRDSYQSDVGLHIAKTVWGATSMIKNNKFVREHDSLDDKIQAWGVAYRFGSGEYDNNEESKKEIIELNKKIFEKSDKKINEIYNKGKKASIDSFENIYKKLETKFDYYFFESEVAILGKKIVEDNLDKVFEKGENGAIIFKGEKFNLHTRVFLNSEGLPTYEAKDLALAEFKYGKYKYDESIVITANEQNEYFKVMLCAMSQIFPELAKKTKHIGHGMMRLPEGKMSSRTGKVVTFDSLLGKVEKLVKEKIKNRDLSEIEKNEIIEQVAVGALKYSILKQSIGSDIIYDFEKSINFQGDSGPYLQYSYARAISVLHKAKEEKIKPSLKKFPAQISQLEKMMHYFPEAVERAGKELEPHHVLLYVTELASAFNNYYGQNKIVDKDDEFSPYKIALTKAFSIIMENGLWLLGISAPQKM